MKSKAWKIAGMVVALCGSAAMAEEGGETKSPDGMKGARPGPEEIMKRFDADGDGTLSEAELQVMLEAMPNRHSGAEGPPRHRPSREEIMERFDSDGNGELSEAEREAMHTEQKCFREENRKRFDADGDGQLSEAERKTMWETLREERPARPPEESDSE